jgi:adenylylsulfate kinase
VVICCFVSPTIAIREQARTIIGTDDFLEVFVDTPLEVCEARDVKGLYAKARAGEVKDFTGISAPFEPPTAPALRIAIAGLSEDTSTDALLNFILPRIKRA